jgi:hypothetical protein
VKGSGPLQVSRAARGYRPGVSRYELRQESGCTFVAWPEVSDKTIAASAVITSRADLVALQQAGHVVTLDEVTQSLFDDCFPDST